MKRILLLLILFVCLTPADLYAKKVKQLTPTITWEIRGDTLVISGTGDMPDNKQPWHSKIKKIRHLIINDGITRIGNENFARGRRYNYAFKSIIFPTTLREIGEGAFRGANLWELKLPAGLREIEDFAFRNIHLWSEELILPYGLALIGKETFMSISPCPKIFVPETVYSIGQFAFARYLYTQKYACEFEGIILNLPKWLTEKDCEVIGISNKCFNEYSPTSYSLCNKGCEYYNKNDYMTACEYFLKGTSARESEGKSINNYRPICCIYAAKCYRKLDNLEEALKMIEQAEKLGGSKSEINSIKFDILEQNINKKISTGEYSSAFSQSLEAYAIDIIKGLDIILQVPRHFVSCKDYTSAIEYFKKAYEKTQNRSEIAKEIAQTYISISNYSDAFDWSIKGGESKLVGKHLEDKKDYSNAVKYYKKAYEIKSDSSLANHIADIYFKQKDYTNAIEWYSIKARAGDKETQYKLAQAYEKADNKNLAIFWYKKAAEQKHLKAEEALAHYGVYITYQPNTSTSSSASKTDSHTSSASSSSNTNDSKSNKSTYTPEYGFRDVWVQCPQCHGSGKCWSCHGNGWCVSTRYDGSYNSTYQCPICNGTGNCTTCFGTGSCCSDQRICIGCSC